MPAILTIPPVVEPLSLAEVKDHLKVETIADDALITRLITTARQQVEKQINKVLINQSWAIYLDNWLAYGEVELPVSPVNQINNLRTFSIDDIASIVDPSHYYADLVSDPQRLILRGSRIWQKPGRPANGIEIDVTAGFGTEGDSVPGPLRQAMFLLITHWYENRQPDCSGAPIVSVTSALQALLAPYKRVRL